MNGKERTQVRKEKRKRRKRGIQREKNRRQEIKYAKRELNGIYITSII